MATARDVGLLEAQLFSCTDTDHLAHEIDARDHLRHRMLHLDAGVHLDEVERLSLIVVEVFECPCPR